MLSDDEVIAYCQRLGLSSQAQEVLAAIRNGPVHSQPAGSTDQYAPAGYPSRKMAHVIQAESITCEFPFLLEMEQNDNVSE